MRTETGTNIFTEMGKDADCLLRHLLNTTGGGNAMKYLVLLAIILVACSDSGIGTPPKPKTITQSFNAILCLPGQDCIETGIVKGPE